MIRSTDRPIHLTLLLRLCLVLSLILGGPLLLLSTVEPAIAQDGGAVHIVLRGETLSAIAAKYGIPYWRLAAYNGIRNPNQLYVGQVIRIPIAYVPSATSVPPISSSNIVPMPTVSNNMKAPRFEGEPTVAPALPAPTKPATAASTSRNGEVSYTVHRGDSIYSIAARYTVSTEAIVQRNNLPSTIIHVGQRLIIPTGSYAMSQARTSAPAAPARATPTPNLPQPSPSVWMTPRLMNDAPTSLKWP